MNASISNKMIQMNRISILHLNLKFPEFQWLKNDVQYDSYPTTIIIHLLIGEKMVLFFFISVNVSQRQISPVNKIFFWQFTQALVFWPE